MRFVLFAAALFASTLAPAQQIMDARATEIVIKNVTVVPMDAETLLPKQTVVIKAGFITAIGEKVQYGKNAVVINGKGKYLMPGLAEMHGHIHANDDEQLAKDLLVLYAVNGVTMVKNMLGSPMHLTLRDQAASGKIIGPRIITAGPQFSGRDVKTPEEAIAQVKSQKKAGYDLLKIKEGLTLPVFEAISRTAKEEHIPFGGHVPLDVGIFNAAKLGFSTVDHLDGFFPALIPGIAQIPEKELGIFGSKKAYLADFSKLDEVLQVLRQNHVWVTPTQSFAEHWQSPARATAELLKYPEMKYMDKKTIDQWIQMKKGMTSGENYDTLHIMQYLDMRKKIVLACQRQGVGLLAGTDAGQCFMVPGFVLHREMGYLVDAGLTPYEALKTGTYNAGKFLGNEHLGVVRQGAVADLILIDGNPLKDIHAIDQISGVMLNGRWMDKRAIAKLLKTIEQRHKH
jgi:hypothetical protein